MYFENKLIEIARKKRFDEIEGHLSKDEKAKIINEANQLCHYIFSFDKPWDMERCKTKYEINPLIYETIKNEDEEWCFMLNRMDYLSYLSLAFCLTKDSRYSNQLQNMIALWLDQHHVLENGYSLRTLDTAIRIMNWIEALQVLIYYGCMDEKTLAIILAGIDRQINYLFDHYILKYELSNWGTIQTEVILSVLPLLDENYTSNRIYRWALKELNHQLKIQIYEDGMQWEQSTMYHIEVLNYGLKYLFYNQMNQIQTDKYFVTTYYKMVNAIFLQATPGWKIEAFGDSDYVSVVDVLNRASVLFDESKWKISDRFDMESIYELGIEYANNYLRMPVVELTKLNFDGVESGIFTTKNSNDGQANYTLFLNGSLGSGHGHCDNLHISIFYKGLPFFIDSGRYTYREDHPLREQLKKIESHNTVRIDHIDTSIPKGSWSYEKFCIPNKTYVKHKEGMHYYEGSYQVIDPVQFVKRKVMVIDDQLWFVLDEVIQEGTHSLEQKLIMDPDVKVVKKSATKWLLRNNDIELKVQSLVDGEISRTSCSREYNQIQDTHEIKMTTDFTTYGISPIMITGKDVLVNKIPVYQGDKNIVGDQVATAVKFELSDSESYTVVLFHQELYKGLKVCQCDGVHFHAKALVIARRNGEEFVWKAKV